MDWYKVSKGGICERTQEEWLVFGFLYIKATCIRKHPAPKMDTIPCDVLAAHVLARLCVKDVLKLALIVKSKDHPVYIAALKVCFAW